MLRNKIRDIPGLPEEHLETISEALQRCDRDHPRPLVREVTPADHAALTDRTPMLLGESIRDAYEAAANAIEQACDQLQAELETTIALAREQAHSIRNLSESQASSVEGAAAMIRNLHKQFKQEGDKRAAFRVAGLFSSESVVFKNRS